MSTIADMIVPGETAHGIHVVSLDPARDVDEGWHAHHSGQLYCLSKGVVLIRGEGGILLLHPGSAGWIPPEIPHGSYVRTANAGWVAYIAPKLCAFLPEKPVTLNCSAFVPLLMQRIHQWQETKAITDAERLRPEQERVFQVLVDELVLATAVPGLLPSPVDSRLVRMTRELMEDPADSRTLEEWGKHIGMSARGIRRHFVVETGLSFTQWRRLARLLKARNMLARGATVQETAWDTGYESPSAFISAFREAFGVTPTTFRGRPEGGARK